jgi:hypothetical protein
MGNACKVGASGGHRMARGPFAFMRAKVLELRVVVRAVTTAVHLAP